MRLALALVSLLLLSACGREVLYTSLQEREANEIVAALDFYGIEAEKRAEDEQAWSVLVGKPDFADAMGALADAGLPRQHYDTLGNVFKKEGFVSSPVEEQARYVYARSQELAATLSAIDGVLMARVHLSIFEKPDAFTSPPPASASVLIKSAPGRDLSEALPLIRSIVVNGVEGLTPERVAVAVTPADEAPRRAREDRIEPPPIWPFGLLLAVLGALLAWGGPLLGARAPGPRSAP